MFFLLFTCIQTELGHPPIFSLNVSHQNSFDLLNSTQNYWECISSFKIWFFTSVQKRCFTVSSEARDVFDFHKCELAHKGPHYWICGCSYHQGKRRVLDKPPTLATSMHSLRLWVGGGTLLGTGFPVLHAVISTVILGKKVGEDMADKKVGGCVDVLGMLLKQVAQPTPPGTYLQKTRTFR